MPERLDENDRTPLERLRRRRKDGLEPLDDTRVTGVGKPEQNDACESPTHQGRDLAEVQVEGENDPILRDGLLEDRRVRQPVQTLVPEMQRVVPFSS